MRRWMTILALLAAVAAVAWPQACSAVDAPMPVSGHDAKAQAVADGQGNLHVPSDYRTTYEFLLCAIDGAGNTAAGVRVTATTKR